MDTTVFINWIDLVALFIFASFVFLLLMAIGVEWIKDKWRDLFNNEK